MSRTSLQKCESEQRFSDYYTVIIGKFNCFFRIVGFGVNQIVVRFCWRLLIMYKIDK